jgi:hypothetical protein
MTRKQREYLLTSQEHADLQNALDVLCGCYGEGASSPEVQELLARYGPGTPAGTRARLLFGHINRLSCVPLEAFESA